MRKKPRVSSARRKRQPPPPLDSQQRYDIRETSAYLRKSVSTLYVDIAEGKLRVIKDGGRTYVPGSEIARLSSVEDRKSVV